MQANLVTEDAAAQQFSRLYAGRLRYDHSVGSWYEWTGACWQQNCTRLAFHWARELARELVASEPDRVRYVSSKTGFARGVEAFSQADPTFAVTADLWDRDPFQLGTPGGTVDLRTGILRAAHPDNGITKLSAVAPSETSACPRWRQFLHEACGGDVDRVRFLQMLFGYALTGDTREHALFFIHGPGGNGKSVFLNVLAAILGAYATTAPMETFTQGKFDRHPTELALLKGARLVTASETEEGRSWAESRIKSLTGGDTISARYMRQDFFNFVPQFKLIITGNHKPVLNNVDDAARRRFNIIPFIHKPMTPDRDLERKLRAEYPEILRWAIEGCLDWQRYGLVKPASVSAETDAYFSDQDLLAQWLEDECDLDLGNDWKWESVANLFASWSSYLVRAGERPSSKKSFSESLVRRGLIPCKKERSTVRAFEGVRLLKQDQGGGNGE
jgi:putative DNA primase/helicase